MSITYAQDFYGWAYEQAALLRSGRLTEADIENIAEEIERMGRSEKRELVSRLTVVLVHPLKWQFQPSRRGSSWEASVQIQRLELADHLVDNLSLRPQLPDALVRAYHIARLQAGGETDLGAKAFPATCVWTSAQVLDSAFWPEAA